MKSPVVLLSRLFEDFERLEPGVRGLDRDLKTIKSRFEHEGFSFLSITLSSLGNAFDRGLADGRFTCPTSFSRTKSGALPKLFQGLLCKVFDVKSGQLLENPCVHTVKCIREVLYLFKKVKLASKREEVLVKEAILDFYEVDRSLGRLVLPEDLTYYVDSVTKLILPNLDGFEEQDLQFRHGPGSVRSTSKANRKWVDLIDVCRTDTRLGALFGVDDLIFRNHFRPLDCPMAMYAPTRDAKLVTVPKDSTSLRTITVEPVEKQYFQQGLNSHLRSEIRRCRILSRCLALTDQTVNQKFAVVGSLTGKFATLDLSKASDRLTTDVVKRIFGHRKKFLELLLESRSSVVSAGSDSLRTRKYAGMGNATTFPVQSICFAVIAISAILHSGGTRPTYWQVVRAAKRVRVFGDDIIIDSRYSRQVIQWLTSFGLQINQKKSFTTGNFRESCGVDAFRGHDVTPTYLRVSHCVTVRDPEQIASLVSTSNQLWLKGLYSTATFLREQVERVLPLPLVSSQCSALGWHSRVDTNVAPMRWDGKLQRLVFRAWYIKPAYQPDDISNDEASLLKTLSNARDDRFQPIGYWDERQLDPLPIDDRHLERSVKRFKTRIARRWEPARAG